MHIDQLEKVQVYLKSTLEIHFIKCKKKKKCQLDATVLTSKWKKSLIKIMKFLKLLNQLKQIMY